MAALANDQALFVELHDTARPSHPWTARSASQDREVFAASLDGTLSCATALILKALREEPGSSDTVDVSCPKPAALSFGALSTIALATSTFAAKMVRLLDKVATGGRTWAIGWRFDQSASLFDKSEAGFRVLAGGPPVTSPIHSRFAMKGRISFSLNSISTRRTGDALRS